MSDEEYKGEERRNSDSVYVDIAVLKEARKASDSALVEIKESFHDLKADIRTGNRDLLEGFAEYAGKADKRITSLERWRSYLAGAYTAGIALAGVWIQQHWKR